MNADLKAQAAISLNQDICVISGFAFSRMLIAEC